MRVGVTNDTTCFGVFPTKVSDIEIQEPSNNFPTYEASAGPGGMELKILLLQNIQSNQGSSPQTSLPRYHENISQLTSHDLNILSWNLQGYSHDKYKVLYHSPGSPISTGQRRSLHQIQILQKGERRKPTNDSSTFKIPSVRMLELETNNTLVFKVIFKKFQLLIVNIHLTSPTKLEWKATLETFQYSAAIVGGDINYQMRKNPNLYYDLISHQASRKNKDRTKFRQIDYLMINRNIEWKMNVLQNISDKFSDQKPISISFTIPQEDLFQRLVINIRAINQHIIRIP